MNAQMRDRPRDEIKRIFRQLTAAVEKQLHDDVQRHANEGFLVPRGESPPDEQELSTIVSTATRRVLDDDDIDDRELADWIGELRNFPSAQNAIVRTSVLAFTPRLVEKWRTTYPGKKDRE